MPRVLNIVYLNITSSALNDLFLYNIIYLQKGIFIFMLIHASSLCLRCKMNLFHQLFSLTICSWCVKDNTEFTILL